MRTHSRFFRLTATTAIVGLALGPLLPQTGLAQSAPPPLAPPAATPAPATQTTVDPPTRVGRLAQITGQVSFHGIGADHWDVASLNFPVTSGDSFWTQPAASADLGVTSNRVTLDQSTELDVATLDDHSFVATIPQGQVYLRLLALAPGETYTVTTPRGTVAITAPGRYEISAGDTQNPTRVTVLEGSAQISGGSINLQVAANQTVLITGTDPFQTQVVPAQRDAFLTAQLARDRPPPVYGGVTAPAVVTQMTGGADLSAYGTWQEAPQYGTVWYPQAAAGFVPYRNGSWAYVAPWGWTWVDAAPWGFAPFHYGRWVQIDGRWGWAPGGGVAVYGSPEYVAPVYAPALVTFFGIGAAIGVGVGIGIGIGGGFGGNVGWCPLGWQEPYHPWYHSSPNYLRNVNVTSVRNVTNITTINNTTINNFANRGAATMVPANAMLGSRSINQVARPLPAAQFAEAHPVIGREPLAPSRETLGVTPRVAQNLHLAAPPPGAGAVARPQAPGPAIRAQAAAPNERPALEPNARAPAAAPLAGHEPAAPAAEPHAPAAEPHAPTAAVTPHAPGPPIEPRGAAGAPNATPALRPPVEAAHPETTHPEVTRPEVAGQHPAATTPRPEVGPAAAPHPQAEAPRARPPAAEPAARAEPVHEPVQHPPAAQHPVPQEHREAAPAREPPRRPEQPQARQAPPPEHRAAAPVRAVPQPAPHPQPHPQAAHAAPHPLPHPQAAHQQAQPKHHG